MDTDDEIIAKLVQAQEMLEALQSGKLHLGAPFEGRTEAKIYDLQRQIAEHQSILDKRRARGEKRSEEAIGDISNRGA